jgi:hypothetical protein
MVRPAVVLCTLAACAHFEQEDVVVDMRVLAMQSDVPEQVLDVDLANPPAVTDLLAQMTPTTVCALVADPVQARGIHWDMTLCVLNDEERCRVRTAPFVVLAEGDIDDPETTAPEPQMCATVMPDGNLAGIILQAVMEDSIDGLGGIDYGIGLRVRASGDPADTNIFAAKTLRVSPRIPANRVANHNPPDTPFTAAKDGVNPLPFPMGRCVDQTAPLTIVPTQRVRLEPVEPDGAREAYVVPTIDGQSEMFTESLTYQWLGSAGGFSSDTTGGPRNRATGDPAPLFSDFRAPPASAIDAFPLDISIWVIQRDERLGAHWYESCIRVVPE